MTLSGIAPFVLDTFVFENSKIYLKQYHIQRSFEAINLVKQTHENAAIFNLYNKIESDWATQSAEQLFRLQINPTDINDYRLEVKAINKISTTSILLHPVFNFDYNNIKNSNYKWNDRKHWDVFNSKINEFSDVLSVNQNSELVETSRFSLFAFDIQSNVVKTPPSTTGCLKGVYRQSCLDNGYIDLPQHGRVSIVESSFYFNELSNFKIYVGNSVRKLIPAEVNS